MKKRNESFRSAKASRSSSDQERKNSARTPSERPSRGEGSRSRFPEADNERSFRPKRKITEKLFNKPTLKKSHLQKLAFDSSTGKNPFDKERGAQRDERPSRREGGDFDKRSDVRTKGEFRPRREGGSSERAPRRFDRDERPSRRDDRDSDKRSDARAGGEFRPRREESGSERAPRRFDRDERPARRDDRDSDKRSDARAGGEFRPRREESGSERAPRRFDREERGPKRDYRGPRQEDQRPERGRVARRSDQPDAEATNEAENRRVGKFSRAPRYDFSDYEDKKNRFKKHTDEDVLRLNRYIANAGICSRREADELIESGQITVNGTVVTEMGYKVKRSDIIKYGKKILNPEKLVYLLINKPKDYITTTDDPEERKTVMDLVAGACEERIYPVGRLDRNTTGLLLLTNDGELAEKLTHPSSNIHKIYQAELDKPITTEDFEAIQAGFELEDGFIKPDDVGLVTPDAMVVGLEIHSGKNRIVRRMFEHFGYEVKKLDRTVFAGLNKKDLPRGKWRFLTEKEVIKLKFLI